MNIHKNARTTPYSRAEIVRRVLCVTEWLGRYRTEGKTGLADRSARPRR